MLHQYLEIKEQYPGTILFYRTGDFYERFYPFGAMDKLTILLTKFVRTFKMTMVSCRVTACRGPIIPRTAEEGGG